MFESDINYKINKQIKKNFEINIIPYFICLSNNLLMYSLNDVTLI